MQEIIESKANIDGVNTDEVALVLACFMTQAEIDSEHLTHVVHRCRSKKGARPGLSCPALTGGEKVRAENDSWLPPLKKPTAPQTKQMVGCLAKCAVKLVMTNHFYSFNN